jgi:hypothetical protein
MKKTLFCALALLALSSHTFAANNCIKLTKHDGTVSYTASQSVCHKHCAEKWSADPNNTCNQACKNPKFYVEACGKK